MMMDKKKTKTFLISTFVIAWVLQILASYLYEKVGLAAFQILLMVAMFAPFAGAILAKFPIREMGWKPKLKGNLRFVAAAWLLPSVFTLLGAALYFALFPTRVDVTGAYLTATYGEVMMEQLEAQGLTYPLFILVSAASAIFYAPWVNMFIALGEEVGWRGVLYPQLRALFGKTKGRILGGIIWGAWHWPVMILAGYEYGKEYPGAPLLGMGLFCVYATAAGILVDVLYEKTSCIWVPSLAHGAINGCAALPIYLLNPDYTELMVLGPAPMGIISMLPTLILAVWVLWREWKNGKDSITV